MNRLLGSIGFGCMVLAPLGLRAAEPPLAVALTTLYGKRHVFHEGDRIGFFVRPNRDAHVVLLYQFPDGTIQLNSGERRLAAGAYHPIPSSPEGPALVVGAPFGCDRVWAFATENKPPLLPGRWRTGLKYLPISPEAVHRLLVEEPVLVASTSIQVCTVPGVRTGASAMGIEGGNGGD